MPPPGAPKTWRHAGSAEMVAPRGWLRWSRVPSFAVATNRGARRCVASEHGDAPPSSSSSFPSPPRSLHRHKPPQNLQPRRGRHAQPCAASATEVALQTAEAASSSNSSRPNSFEALPGGFVTAFPVASSSPGASESEDVGSSRDRCAGEPSEGFGAEDHHRGVERTSHSEATSTSDHYQQTESDTAGSSQKQLTLAGKHSRSAAPLVGGSGSSGGRPSPAGFTYAPAERDQIRGSWDTLMRWSKAIQRRNSGESMSSLEETSKVVVFGGGSFGTAMGASLATQKSDMDVVMLLRDPYLCRDINVLHCNTRYLADFKLPLNVRATTSAAEAIQGAQFAVHAVPVQASRTFLRSIKDLLPPTVPLVCVSKGLELGTGLMMSELIPSALERKQPAVFISGPSFAKEVMEQRPTGVVAACRDLKLATTVQELFASRTMRVNTTSDVVGVEICGALKNVLAIAAGIVEGLDLGHNSMAALIVQGCSEIRWLAEKMGAKPKTVAGLSGLGDIMLTCYGSLSRNRSVGVRLGKGDNLADIIASTSQVAEGVATAGVVVSLARKYRVSLPVLTAVAQVLDNNISATDAVNAIMNLPQIEEN